MALTVNWTGENGWPPVVATGDADACMTDVVNTLISWIYSSGNVTFWTNTAAAGAGGNTSASITGTLDYASGVNELAAITDEYPNNIKSTAWATIPGYPSASNSDNPFPTRTVFGNRFKHRDAIINNSTYNGLGGFSGTDHTDTIQVNESPSPNFNWDATASSTSTPAGGNCKLWGTLFHEWSHMFGRVSGVALSTSGLSLVDMFMYSGSGTRNITGSGTRYLSVDGGVTSLGACNQSGSGDFEGFVADGSVQSPLTYQSLVGVSRKPRFEDVQLMSALGLPLTKVGLIAAGLPNATAMPTITGTPSQGNTLSAGSGTWDGTTAKGGLTTGAGWQWQRNGVSIASATSSAYTVQSADAGTAITVVETASNWIGNNTATSAGVTISAASSPSFGSLSLQLHR